MEQNLRQRVRDRAGNRCEYCGIHQEDERFFTHHIEHIIAQQHGGETAEGNLALACYHCNLHKGTNLTGVDPETSQIVQLFHPRQQLWPEHFATQGVYIVGLTPTGRATIRVLSMNSRERLELRSFARNHPA